MSISENYKMSWLKGWFLLLLLYSLCGGFLFAQETKEKPEKKPVSLSLSYKKADGEVSVKLSATQKDGKKSVPVEGAISNLYLNKIKKHDLKTGTGCVTDMVLNEDGEAVYILTGENKNIVDGKHEFKFIGRLYEDPRYEDTQEELNIKDANIAITVTEKDSDKTVTAKLTEWQEDGTEVPVKGTKVKLYIQRSFSQLLFGGDALATDENGEVSAQLPRDVIGESNGTLIVGGKVEDNDSYGTVQTSKAIPWSILPKVNVENKGNLWSSGRNAPYSLVIISLTIILGIWGVIAYLVRLLFKIRKMGK
jgi:hypothetical protein